MAKYQKIEKNGIVFNIGSDVLPGAAPGFIYSNTLWKGHVEYDDEPGVLVEENINKFNFDNVHDLINETVEKPFVNGLNVSWNNAELPNVENPVLGTLDTGTAKHNIVKTTGDLLALVNDHQAQLNTITHALSGYLKDGGSGKDVQLDIKISPNIDVTSIKNHTGNDIFTDNDEMKISRMNLNSGNYYIDVAAEKINKKGEIEKVPWTLEVGTYYTEMQDPAFVSKTIYINPENPDQIVINSDNLKYKDASYQDGGNPDIYPEKKNYHFNIHAGNKIKTVEFRLNKVDYELEVNPEKHPIVSQDGERIIPVMSRKLMQSGAGYKKSEYIPWEISTEVYGDDTSLYFNQEYNAVSSKNLLINTDELSSGKTYTLELKQIGSDKAGTTKPLNYKEEIHPKSNNTILSIWPAQRNLTLNSGTKEYYVKSVQSIGNADINVPFEIDYVNSAHLTNEKSGNIDETAASMETMFIVTENSLFIETDMMKQHTAQKPYVIVLKNEFKSQNFEFAATELKSTYHIDIFPDPSTLVAQTGLQKMKVTSYMEVEQNGSKYQIRKPWKLYLGSNYGDASLNKKQLLKRESFVVKDKDGYDVECTPVGNGSEWMLSTDVDTFYINTNDLEKTNGDTTSGYSFELKNGESTAYNSSCTVYLSTNNTDNFIYPDTITRRNVISKPELSPNSIISRDGKLRNYAYYNTVDIKYSINDIPCKSVSLGSDPNAGPLKPSWEKIKTVCSTNGNVLTINSDLSKMNKPHEEFNFSIDSQDLNSDGKKPNACPVSFITGE